jgi:putative membrane protein
MLKIASGVITGFEVYGFWTAVFGALIIGSVSWLLNAFVGGQGRVERSSYIDLQKKGDRWE